MLPWLGVCCMTAGNLYGPQEWSCAFARGSVAQVWLSVGLHACWPLQLILSWMNGLL